MKRNDKGIAVPLNMSPLPWHSDNLQDAAIIDSDAGFVAIDATRDDADYIVHAANYHERLACLVRTSAQWNESGIPHIETLLKFISDSAKLWDEMSIDK